VVSHHDICKSSQVADREVDGQNGKHADGRTYIQTPACSLRVIARKVHARTVVLKVGGLGAGRLTVSGAHLKKARKTLKAATVTTITVKRTGHAKPTRVKVSFDPAGAAKAKSTSKKLSS
jgi:hypothetical protein